jgi:hypothetical protein
VEVNPLLDEIRWQKRFWGIRTNYIHRFLPLE